MLLRPRLVRKILLTLASLQGEENNPDNEEEPGKIVHEYRRTVVDGKPLDNDSARIFKELSRHWGGKDTELVYYGSVGSTPPFFRTLGKYKKH